MSKKVEAPAKPESKLEQAQRWLQKAIEFEVAGSNSNSQRAFRMALKLEAEHYSSK